MLNPVEPGGTGQLQNYLQWLVQGAPPNRDNTGPDISRADFTWCMTAVDWGWSIEATAAQLMEESSKARENGERHAFAHGAERTRSGRAQAAKPACGSQCFVLL